MGRTSTSFEEGELVMQRVGPRKWRLKIDGRLVGPLLTYEEARPYILGTADRRELLDKNEVTDVH